MRVSVPTITVSVSRHAPLISPQSAVDRIAAFLAPGNVAVLTGAGVSVDSGIRAYRGKDGRYVNPNYKPIFVGFLMLYVQKWTALSVDRVQYHELVDETDKGHAFRQRYWLRSYLGYPRVRDAQPNTTHYALATLQYVSIITRLITQNVDGLHHKSLRQVWDDARMGHEILELHGTLHKVSCKHGHIMDRDSFQECLSQANPRWRDFAAELEASGHQPRTNPDGDVELGGVSYNDFVVPDCPVCLLENRVNAVHKPQVTFFGESIPKETKERSLNDIQRCDRLLVIGTTLATFSAFSLLKRALEVRKPVMMLNLGPTRADGLHGVEKIELPGGTYRTTFATSFMIVHPWCNFNLMAQGNSFA